MWHEVLEHVRSLAQAEAPEQLRAGCAITIQPAE